MNAVQKPRRNTWQREAVRGALSETEGFVSAQSLHAHLRDGGSTIGLATVYRALSDLATEGDADSLQQDGESLYRACTTDKHHHHLICTQCGTVEDVPAASGLEDLLAETVATIDSLTGFHTSTHRIDLVGICGRCA